MKLLKETTKWDCDMPSLTYVVDGYQCFGFINNQEYTIFEKPMSFSRKGRSFKEVKDPIALKLITKLSCAL